MPTFTVKKLTNEQKNLRRRIIEISYESHLSHLGSCLSAIDLIDAIYKIKKPSEKFVLSNGHAGIAWYTVLEKHGFLKKSDVEKLHIHPDRDVKKDIYVSTGSLGQGLPIAVGIAIADRKKNVYCMLSDGECTEGSIWEALKVIYDYHLSNLKIIINANGWSAYNKINLQYLVKRMKAFGFDIQKVNGHDSKTIEKLLGKNTKTPSIIFAYTNVEQFPFLKGQDAHYYIMNKQDYDLAIEALT